MRFMISTTILLLFLSACSSNNPASSLSNFEKSNQHLKNTCQEGLGSAGSCHALAKKYENPSSGLMADFFNAAKYYQYAVYGYKKECVQDNYGFACLQLGNLYDKGKGGLLADKAQAYKFHKKACDNPSMKRNQFCSNIKNHYKDYLAGIDKKRREDLETTQKRREDLEVANREAKKNMTYNGRITLDYVRSAEFRAITKRAGKLAAIKSGCKTQAELTCYMENKYKNLCNKVGLDKYYQTCLKLSSFESGTADKEDVVKALK